MSAYPYIPGVPAAGHIYRGYWHPGRVDGCRKCPRPHQDMNRADARTALIGDGYRPGEADKLLDDAARLGASHGVTVTVTFAGGRYSLRNA